MTTHKPRRPAAELDSLEMLGHGIFAITMTLLVLDLRVPSGYAPGHLWAALHPVLRPAVAYGLGFVYLLGSWMSMREVFRRHSSMDAVQTICWLVALGLVSLTPFTVSLAARAAGDSHDLAVAVRLMAVTVGSTYLLTVIAALRAATRGHYSPRPWLRTKMIAFAIAPAVAAIPLSYISPWLAIAALLADVVLGLVSTALHDRTLLAPAAPQPRPASTDKR